MILSHTREQRQRSHACRRVSACLDTIMSGVYKIGALLEHAHRKRKEAQEEEKNTFKKAAYMKRCDLVICCIRNPLDHKKN